MLTSKPERAISKQAKKLPRLFIKPRAVPTASSGAVRLHAKVIEQSERRDTPRHILFLHGLFGKGQAFQFIAKNRHIQNNFTCHLLDMRNHGASARSPAMDYQSQANDIHNYLQEKGLEKEKVTLVGHSMGAKTAMAYSCLHPNNVEKLVSLDSSPVDRNKLPHLNESTQRMIEEAIAMGSFEDMPLEKAVRKIKSEASDPVLETALLFNLNSNGSLQVNLQAIHDNQESIYGFPELEQCFEGRCLMINGAESFQREILDHVRFYNKFFPQVADEDIVMVEKAGHGLHFEQPILVRKLIHDFVLESTEAKFAKI